MPGSGTPPAFATTETLSRPFELSFPGSALRKSSVVDEPLAVNEVLNSSQTSVPVVVLLLVKAPSNDQSSPPVSTSTVLVVPKIPPGS